MHQMGLAQTDAAVNEQGVVQVPGHVRDMHGGSPGHAVGRTLHQRVEGQRRIEPVALPLQDFFLDQFGWLFNGLSFPPIDEQRRFRNGFPGSKR